MLFWEAPSGLPRAYGVRHFHQHFPRPGSSEAPHTVGPHRWPFLYLSGESLTKIRRHPMLVTNNQRKSLVCAWRTPLDAEGGCPSPRRDFAPCPLLAWLFTVLRRGLPPPLLWIIQHGRGIGTLRRILCIHCTGCL